MTEHSDRTLVRCVTAVLVATSVLSWAQLLDQQNACLCIGLAAHGVYFNCRIVDVSSIKNLMIQNTSTFDRFMSVVPVENCHSDDSGEKSSRRARDSDPQTLLSVPSM